MNERAMIRGAALAAASMILTVAAAPANGPAAGPGEGKKSRQGRLTPVDRRDSPVKPKSDSLARMLSRAKRYA